MPVSNWTLPGASTTPQPPQPPTGASGLSSTFDPWRVFMSTEPGFASALAEYLSYFPTYALASPHFGIPAAGIGRTLGQARLGRGQDIIGALSMFADAGLLGSIEPSHIFSQMLRTGSTAGSPAIPNVQNLAKQFAGWLGGGEEKAQAVRTQLPYMTEQVQGLLQLLNQRPGGVFANIYNNWMQRKISEALNQPQPEYALIRLIQQMAQ